MLILFLVFLTAVTLTVSLQVSRMRMINRRKSLGYWVTVLGGEWHVVYHEGERWLSMNFELGGFGQQEILYVPSMDKWLREMPDWAKNRRTEIVERVIGELGTKEW